MRYLKWIFVIFFLIGPGFAGEVQVIDGDTLRIDDTRVRLWGIDAPEDGQLCDDNGREYDCGALATGALTHFIDGHPVHCRRIDTDRYGRTVARCIVAGRDLGAVMVRSGWALDYRYYSQGDYQQEQRQAQRAKIGLWAGAFRPPWLWRRDSRERKKPLSDRDWGR